MRLSRLSLATLPVVVAFVLAVSARDASADPCNCVAVAGDVAAGIAAEVAKADTLYARGDFGGALAIYARIHASSKESVLLYAQGMANLQLGARDKAKALFQAYLAAGGNLAYKDKVEAQMGILPGATAAVSKGVGAVGGLAGGLVGGVGGDVGATGRGTVDTTTGVAATGVGVAGGVAGGVAADVKGKTKIGRSAGIALGVIAVAALGAVLIHAIAAGVKDDIELDPKFDLGMGIAGVSVGISAIYVGGLTAAAGAAAGAPCLGAKADHAKPIGLAAGFHF